MVLVKESGIQTRDYYKSNVGVTVDSSDILAYYVWIPRYKYKLWNVTGTPGIDSYDAYRTGIDIIFAKNQDIIA